jgi:hypothetical protein
MQRDPLLLVIAPAVLPLQLLEMAVALFEGVSQALAIHVIL